MQETPNKGPNIRHLGKHIFKYDKRHNLEVIANQNEDIDKVLSNEFWINPTITDVQEMCLVKFRTGQYLGHARKQFFFG